MSERAYIEVPLSEPEASARCGCRLEMRTDDDGRGRERGERFWQCPMHKAAPMMLAWIRKQHDPDHEVHPFRREGLPPCDICVLLAQIKGK